MGRHKKNRDVGSDAVKTLLGVDQDGQTTEEGAEQRADGESDAGAFEQDSKPRKERKKRSREEDLDLAVCQGIMKPVFDVASSWLVRTARSPEVALLPEEVKALADAWGGVLHLYAPAALVKHGQLVQAGMVTGTIAVRLVGVMDTLIKQRKAYAANGHHGMNGAGHPGAHTPDDPTPHPGNPLNAMSVSSVMSM